MQIDPRAVHRRIVQAFPMLIADGWHYRGFGPDSLGGQPFVNLRWEKFIRGKRAYVSHLVSMHTINDARFGLRDWILDELSKAELSLIEQRVRELDCHGALPHPA